MKIRVPIEPNLSKGDYDMKPKYIFILTVIALLVGACAPAVKPFGVAPTQQATEPATSGYSVDINPADFVAVVDNPYFPRIAGDKFVYEGQTANGFERIELVILDETKVIMGVTTTIMRDTVYLDGQVIEDTFDWFAQDKQGNVWYFGEDVNDYENGILVSKAGSWEAGVDGALPGIVMYGDPAAHAGETYLQEYYAGQAEDTADLISVNESVEIAFGSFENVVQTYDYTPLDPTSQERKFYAAGLGTIKSVNLVTGDEVDLIAYIPAGGVEALGIPVAPQSARVDLVTPVFSNPTNVTNPLFPYSQTDQIILLGSVDGQLFHVIYTLLPTTKKINWNGQQVETIIVQYVAQVNGQIEEYALDWYAQADDGAVWYLGEDVFDYKDGVVFSTAGTWLTERDGPMAMIMPANPQVGDVYRVETIPGVAFEEITVKAVNVTVQGPKGRIDGAMVAEQLHMDGSYSNKTFVPGYGEFVTITGTELEALALAVPLDALPGPTPPELVTLTNSASKIFDMAQAGDWVAAATSVDSMVTAWNTYQAGNVPIMLESQMSAALNTLAGAVNAQQTIEARLAGLNAAKATLDLQLQYRPPAEIDLARFKLLAQQVVVDVEREEPGAVKSDAVLLGLIRDRIAHTLDGALAASINALLDELHTSANKEDLQASAEAAEKLLSALE
jgi:hypothetical protein